MKVFVASFHRASDGALSKLIRKLKENDMLTKDYKKAEMILACGDREETFDFTLKRFRENRKIIHLWAGEISQGTHDEVYRHAITLMSNMQLCTNKKAKERAETLCRSVDKKPNAYVVGNIYLDNFQMDESEVINGDYDLVLYNPSTRLGREAIEREIEKIIRIVRKPYAWIEPNGDMFSELVMPYVTMQTLPRPKFLGLLKNCRRFISNSSSLWYEAKHILKPDQIIPIGIRNVRREIRYTDTTIPNATENVIKALNEHMRGQDK